MRTKLIAVDMDGTALNSRKEITAGTRRAVRAARALGVKVVVATGRIAGDAAMFAREMGADREMIVAGGAALGDAETGKNRTSMQIAVPLCAAILAQLQKSPVMLMVYVDEQLYSRPCDMEKWTACSVRSEGASGCHVVVDDIAAAVQAGGLPVSKIFVGGEPAALRAVADEMRPLAGITVTSSGADNIEVMPLGADKGTALRALARELGVEISETLAIGDSDNDHAMLRAAGTAVVMGNGDAATRAMADFVTDDNDHEGVANAIYHYLPQAREAAR